MAANTGNVDVILDTGDLTVPHCAHGPTLLFTRYSAGGSEGRKFFACAAFRDKKLCPFFQWADEKHPHKPDRERDRATQSCQLWPTLVHKKCRKRMKAIRKMKQADRVLCVDCGLLLLPGERGQHEGQGHKMKSPISKQLMSAPTSLFGPLENNRTYAQYLFSQKTVEFVLSALCDLHITHVLCVGCPRIHESIQLQKKSKSDRSLSSLLLDLDHRYLQVYPPSRFCRYNMLNHYFFGGETDQETFHHFIKEDAGKRVAMVIDPPFGVMVDALCVTISKIQDSWHDTKSDCDAEHLPVIWFFPYFMERRVTDSTSGYTMLDYKVDYENHTLFTSGQSGRKRGSPVRIFTNIPPRSLVLPADEGYWYCAACERYSAAENRHCDKCADCTTKDGNTYRHCEKCDRCVKPSRRHCDTCNICDIQDHKCGQARGKGCHICGELDHKRRDCPNKDRTHDTTETGQRKRKKVHGLKSGSKKKRKLRQ